MKQNLFITLLLFLLSFMGTHFSQSVASSISTLYFLATEDRIKLLDQKLEYHVLDKTSIQIGNMIISNNNIKLMIDAKENFVAVGPQQLMIDNR